MHWLQIIDALPKTWKDKENAENLDIFDNNIATKSQICSLNKLTSKVLYSIPVDTNTVKPTRQYYLENHF